MTINFPFLTVSSCSIVFCMQLQHRLTPPFRAGSVGTTFVCHGWSPELYNGLEILGGLFSLLFFNLFRIHLNKPFIRSDLEERLALLNYGAVSTLHDNLVDCSGESCPDRVEHLHDFDDVERLPFFEV